MREFDFGDVMSVARSIQEEVGFDFRYVTPGMNKCEMYQLCVNTYLDENNQLKPSCIVGTILVRLGIDIESIPMYGSVEDVLTSLTGIARFSPKAKKTLKLMQVIQDNGGTWHSAVQTAYSLSSI